MIYARIKDGVLMRARTVHDATGSYDAEAESPQVPDGWQLVASDAEAEAVADEFPELTRRQLRLALLGMSITAAQVDAVIAAIPSDVDRESAQIYWEDTERYNRNHPLIEQVAGALSITTADLDAAWTQAATLDPS